MDRCARCVTSVLRTAQRDVISRGVFTSAKDLDKKLMRHIRQYNKDPKRLKWKYDDPSRRHRQFF